MLTLAQMRRADRRIDTYKDPPRFSKPSELWLTQQAFDDWMDRLDRLARKRSELRRSIYRLAESERLELWARARRLLSKVEHG